MTPLRVDFLIRSLETGGAERQLVVLARGLHRAGHEPRVLLFYGGGHLRAELEACGVPVASLGKTGRWDVARFGARLVRAVRRRRPDVLHAYHTVPNLVAAAARPFLGGTRIVWGVRASDLLERGEHERFHRAAFRATVPAARLAHLVIANSRAGAEFHRRAGYPADRLRVIPNGVATDRFRPDPEARARVRAEWGVPQEAVLIGITARLDPVKDHESFVAAAADVAARRSAARFVVVGDGPEARRRALAARARAAGLGERLLWAGHRSDVPAVMAALDLAVSASLSEGFPNALAEAMAAGTPCVATDAGDSAEIVGDTGVVVPPGDPRALAAGIVSVLDAISEPEAAARRSRACRRRIVERFSEARLVQRTEEALRALG